MRNVNGVFFGKSIVGTYSKEQTPSSVVAKTDVEYKKGIIAPWGADNQFPQKLVKTTGKNGAASGGLSLLKSTHYGNGVTFFKNEKTEKGKRTKVIQYIEDYQELHHFFTRNKMHRFYSEIISDLETFGIAYPSFIISKDFSKITSVKRQPAAWGRREIMNPKTGFSQNVYFKSNWDNEDTKKAVGIASVDPNWTFERIQAYCKEKRIHEFILPLHYPLTDEGYYPKLGWHAVYHNGWLEVSNSIPEYKKHLFENQITVKYKVSIADCYFEKQYRDEWDTYDAEKRNKIKDETMQAIDDHLTGNKASGRSIYVEKFKEDSGNWVSGIDIEAIDNKMKDGSYLPDGLAANTEILFALMVDASLIGGGVPGGKMGSGSGSDKRIAFGILSALFKIKRETTLETWQLLKDWNGWDREIHAAFENTILTTLDKNPNGQQNML